MNNRKDGKKVKKRVFFSFFQTHKKVAFSLIIGISFATFFVTLNYGRYVKEIVQMYYLRTQNFYFSSDKLTINGKTYEINPWSATEPAKIDINMSSLLNSIKGTSENIVYNVSCSATEKVYCYLENRGIVSQERIINTDDHKDSFIVTVDAKEGMTFATGEKVSVTITVESISPYKETLTATFELIIGDYGVNYEIEDEVGNLYFDALVTNTLDCDEVKFKLTIPNKYIDDIFFDMSNNVLDGNATTTTVTGSDGHSYINSITFTVEPKSSILVRYYKAHIDKDYSYTVGDGSTSVITFEELERSDTCD